jgi:quinolinate synthase
MEKEFASTVFAAIRKLKKEREAVILAHYYMPPELQILEKDGGIADFIGDSLGLSIEATKG